MLATHYSVEMIKIRKRSRWRINVFDLFIFVKNLKTIYKSNDVVLKVYIKVKIDYKWSHYRISQKCITISRQYLLGLENWNSFASKIIYHFVNYFMFSPIPQKIASELWWKHYENKKHIGSEKNEELRLLSWMGFKSSKFKGSIKCSECILTND